MDERLKAMFTSLGLIAVLALYGCVQPNRPVPDDKAPSSRLSRLAEQAIKNYAREWAEHCETVKARPSEADKKAMRERAFGALEQAAEDASETKDEETIYRELAAGFRRLGR